jgi:hypothetical protein
VTKSSCKSKKTAQQGHRSGDLCIPIALFCQGFYKGFDASDWTFFVDKETGHIAGKIFLGPLANSPKRTCS